ncbi:MAG: CsgG/HfaB family protein [Syntrophales bacterium]|nr:CsgG/HfaB family protein [Syntrophales bacterium]
MKRKSYRIILTSLFVLVFLSGCAVNESYKMGQDLSNEGRWDDAIVYLQKALDEEPDNQEFRDALQGAKREYARVRYAKAKQTLDAVTQPNLTHLQQAAKEADIALALEPDNKDIITFSDTVKGKITHLQETIKPLYEQAHLDMQKEDWTAAVAKLRQVNSIFPNYEETASRLTKAGQEAARSLYKQGVKLGKQEEWKLAAASFKAVMDINPNYFDVAKLYQDAVSKDNFGYYAAVAEKASQAQNYAKAILLYEKALEYQPDNSAVIKKVKALKDKAGKFYFDEAVALVNQNRFYTALKHIEFIKAQMPATQDDPFFKEFIDKFCRKMMDRADRYVEKELWGNALIWYEKVGSMNPNYPELYEKIRDVREDRIKRRIKKSIAVFDFTSPSNDKDAGRNAADKLVAYLYQKASSDLRIIERENLQNILREMQLGQSGLVDTKSAQTVGKMRGIDTFIMGTVLKHFSSKTDYASMEQVKVLVDEEDVRNPEFSDWLIMNPKPTEADMKNAPPRTIKKRNYQFISYKKGVAKITALFDISYKLVDTATGENIFTNTIAGRLIKEDKYQDGVPVAKIPHDPLEIQVESEVLGELTDQKIAEMGQSVLKHFQSLELEYYNQGLQLQKNRRYDRAIEKFVDAVYNEKLKGISTPVSQNALEAIDHLIQRM